MVYVLDANVIINYLKKDASVTKGFDYSVHEGHRLIIPRVVDYEICRGLDMSLASRKAAIYKDMTRPIPFGQCVVVDMGEKIWGIAKNIYVSLYKKGFTVGEIDILIAAFCLCHDCDLVTSNTKDFANIDGLRLTDWKN